MKLRLPRTGLGQPPRLFDHFVPFEPAAELGHLLQRLEGTRPIPGFRHPSGLLAKLSEPEMGRVLGLEFQGLFQLLACRLLEHGLPLLIRVPIPECLMGLRQMGFAPTPILILAEFEDPTVDLVRHPRVLRCLTP